MGLPPTCAPRFFIRHPLLRRHACPGQQKTINLQQVKQNSTKPNSTKLSQDAIPAKSVTPKTTPATPPTTFSAISTWATPFVQPLAIFAGPFRAYSRIQSRRPYLTQFISSLIIYFLGDLSSQLVQSNDPSTATSTTPFSYDPLRALRTITIGGISSIPSYHFFYFLSNNFNYFSTHIPNLALKVMINQFTFAPLFNSYFFGMQSLLSLEGPQPDAAWRRIKDTVPQSWLMSCRFWPFVTAFSFTFVPVHNRSIFAGVMAVFWQTYLGVVNQRAVVKEKKLGGTSVLSP